MAFLEFAHYLSETKKPRTVLRDNKSVTRFVETKAIPSSPWNASDSVLHFTCKITHIACLVNEVADCLPSLELKVTEKARLEINQDIQTTPIEVTTSSSDVADEAKFFFTKANNEEENRHLRAQCHLGKPQKNR